MSWIQVKETTFIDVFDQFPYGEIVDCRCTTGLEQDEVVGSLNKIYAESSSGSIFLEDSFGIFVLLL
jgi:hypothetical protein